MKDYGNRSTHSLTSVYLYPFLQPQTDLISAMSKENSADPNNTQAVQSH